MIDDSSHSLSFRVEDIRSHGDGSAQHEREDSKNEHGSSRVTGHDWREMMIIFSGDNTKSVDSNGLSFEVIRDNVDIDLLGLESSVKNIADFSDVLFNLKYRRK